MRRTLTKMTSRSQSTSSAGTEPALCLPSSISGSWCISPDAAENGLHEISLNGLDEISLRRGLVFKITSNGWRHRLGGLEKPGCKMNFGNPGGGGNGGYSSREQLGGDCPSWHEL